MAIDVYKDWLGIKEPGPFDHYTLLRLPKFEDDAEKIRNNYKKLNGHVRKYATGQYSVRSQELLNELAKCMLCLTDPERKRDYDEGQGRVFEEDERARPSMDRVLIKQGHMDRGQAKEAQEFAEQRGLTFCDAVVQMKLVDRETATKALAEERGLSYIDLDETPPQFTVLDKLPKQVCRRNTILPLFIDEAVLLVACADELSHELEEELRLRYGLPIKTVLATPQSINAGVEQYYSELKDALAAAAEAGVTTGDGSSRKQASASSAAKSSTKVASGPAKRFNQLPPEEQQKKKQIGYILLMWGLIAPVLIDNYLVKPNISALDFGAFVPSISTILITPCVAFFVLKVYWK